MYLLHYCDKCSVIILHTVEPGISVMFLFWGKVLVGLGGIRGKTGDEYNQNTLYRVLKEFIYYYFFLDTVSLYSHDYPGTHYVG